MSLTLDLILLLVLIVFAIVGRFKGFVNSVLSLSVVVLSFLFSFLLSGVLSDLVFDSFVSKRMENSVSNVLTATVGDTTDEIYGKMPEFITSSANSVGFDLKGLIDEGVSQNTDGYIEELAEKITHSVVRPPMIAVIRIVIFIILFIVLRIVLKIVAKALNIVSHIPVLRSMNATLGLLFGFINGLFTVAAVCFALSAVVSFSGGIFGITPEILQNSFMFRFYDLFLNII